MLILVLRKELEAFAAASNGRLTIHYVLNETPAGWTGGKGFVTRDMIEAHMHAEGVASGGKVLICGPPPMITAMKGHLAGIGYPAPRAVSKLEDQVFLF
jgi:cytochrome-b5 reductase